MTPLVSVIVPIYKTECYLRGCVDSVRAQTWHQLEIILVDDGSPDGSAAICDTYAAQDDRIRVIHQENSGLSAARNAGLRIATGTYVCFVDSDDTLPDNSIADLVGAAQRSGAAYVGALPKKSGAEERVIDFGKAPMELLRYLCTSVSISAWAKLYDLSVIRTKNILFDPELKCAEDALFNRQYLRYCERLCLIAAPIYFQNVENPTSLSKKGYTKYSWYFERKMQALEDLVLQLNITQAQREEFLSYRAIHGLRVSVRHYFSRFSAEAGGLVTEAVKQLLPWVHFDTVPWDRELRIWWQHHRKELEQGDLQTFLKRTRRETLLEKQRAKLARKVRALQKRITGNR